MAQIETMMEEIKGLTVLELNELVKALEDEFGVSAAAAAPACQGSVARSSRLICGAGMWSTRELIRCTAKATGSRASVARSKTLKSIFISATETAK